jgi:hypothetical protein
LDWREAPVAVDAERWLLRELAERLLPSVSTELRLRYELLEALER